MDGCGAAAVAAARACVGARFRAQGRDPATGLDCVGLAAFAVRAGAARLDVPNGYRLRGSVERVAAGLEALGFARAQELAPGDLMVMRAGPGQGHLGVWTGTGLVHADARLRRVVETPGAPGWPVTGVWRFGSVEEEEEAGFPRSRE
ncbi:MAG: peptidoglycan endopeptidase [Sphingomonadaceae bacterium]|nr:peptidoglycan endopeptidase [Sphingomonadaceae bacterium]